MDQPHTAAAQHTTLRIASALVGASSVPLLTQPRPIIQGQGHYPHPSLTVRYAISQHQWLLRVADPRVSWSTINRMRRCLSSRLPRSRLRLYHPCISFSINHPLISYSLPPSPELGSQATTGPRDIITLHPPHCPSHLKRHISSIRAAQDCAEGTRRHRHRPCVNTT